MGISSAILSGNAVFASSTTDCSTLGFAIRFCAVVNAGCISAQKPSLLQCRPFQRSPEYSSDVYSPRPPDIRVRLLPTKPPVHFTTEQPGRDSLLPIFILQRPILSLPRLYCLLEAVKLQYNEQPPCREPHPVKRTVKKYKVFPVSSQVLLAVFYAARQIVCFSIGVSTPRLRWTRLVL